MDNQQEVRENIIRIFNKNPNRSYKTIAYEAKVCRNTVSRVIKQFKERLTVEKRTGCGRKKGYADSEKAKKIVAQFQRKPNISGRKVALKTNCSESFVRKVKKNEGLKSFKVQKVPDRNAKKNEEAKQRAKKLRHDLINNYECCVMDDETYVLGDFSQLPGVDFYVADTRGNVHEQYKTQKKTKFPKKFLVWQAICSCGKRSSSYVTTGTINTELYIKECLQKRLLPFIQQHEVSTFFWPDLASCHYSKSAIEWYENNNVVFVPKEANPPNCPELRPIERYWALVKRELKSTKKVTDNVKNFSQKWKLSSKKIAESTIETLMEGIPDKVKQFIQNN